MYPHVFLLLLSSGVSSYFLPQKEMPHLLKETKRALINEMLCLLKAENGPIKGDFGRPLHIKKESCAHNNTEIFIRELKKIPKGTCMSKVKQDMQKLEKICSTLKNPSSNDKSCSNEAQTDFSKFKKSLQEFLKWINEKLDCRSVGRSESILYMDVLKLQNLIFNTNRTDDWGYKHHIVTPTQTYTKKQTC